MKRHTAMQTLPSLSEIFSLEKKEDYTLRNKYKLWRTLKLITNKLLYNTQLKEAGVIGYICHSDFSLGIHWLSEEID